jgi:hypothetical protein
MPAPKDLHPYPAVQVLKEMTTHWGVQDLAARKGPEGEQHLGASRCHRMAAEAQQTSGVRTCLKTFGPTW